jgi:hypothetical protein
LRLGPGHDRDASAATHHAAHFRKARLASGNRMMPSTDSPSSNSRPRIASPSMTCASIEAPRSAARHCLLHQRGRTLPWSPKRTTHK